jgi:hypothetical protein
VIAIGGQHGHPVLRTDAPRPQQRGEPGHIVRHLRPGAHARAVDGGQSLWMDAGGTVDALCQLHAIAAFSFYLGKTLRHAPSPVASAPTDSQRRR